jgi:type IV pilin
MKQKLSHRNGFTLIEIIISITLLLLIATYGMLKYQNVKESAQQKLDIANAVSFAETLELALMDNPNCFNNKQTIQSTDPIVTKYTHSVLVAKSKKYSGPFNAAINKTSSDEYKFVITANNYTIYPQETNQK